jgi:hypothetical protein
MAERNKVDQNAWNRKTGEEPRSEECDTKDWKYQIGYHMGWEKGWLLSWREERTCW